MSSTKVLETKSMFNRSKLINSLAGLGFFIASTTNSVLAEKVEVETTAAKSEPTSQLTKIEQPLSLKLIVTLGGLSLIGAELWWFVFSKNKS